MPKLREARANGKMAYLVYDRLVINYTIEEDGKMKKAQCLQCQALVSAKADRLRTHLSKCVIKQVKLEKNYAVLQRDC